MVIHLRQNNCYSIYMNKTFCGHTPNVYSLLNLDRGNTHIHSIDAKRCKVDNDSATYLWHCHLGHIGVKHMKKLHADGLLDSLDYESLDACEPCLMGKMTKTPFSRIIHTYVCGPMSVEARGGYRYFLIFTDDLSRYGYIYLMKQSLKYLKSSNNLRVKWRIIITRK